MIYDLVIQSAASKAISKLPKAARRRLDEHIQTLSTNPRPHGYKKLTDRGDYSLRIGDYRIIYLIDDPGQEVVVTVVGDRKEVYRR